jgi:hypothetical protein
MADRLELRAEPESREERRTEPVTQLIERPDEWTRNPMIYMPGESLTPTETALSKAISLMNQRMDNDKLNLSISELQDAKSIETAVVNGDPKRLSDTLKKYAHDPIKAHELMTTVTKDLNAVGIDARWDYGTRTEQSTEESGYHLRGKEDFGILTLAADTDKGDGSFSTVTFSTSGNMHGINRPIPQIDGQSSSKSASPLAPADGLRLIRDKALGISSLPGTMEKR